MFSPSRMITEMEDVFWRNDLQTASELELDIEIALMDVRFQRSLKRTLNPFKYIKHQRLLRKSQQEVKRLIGVRQQHLTRMRESLA